MQGGLGTSRTVVLLGVQLRDCQDLSLQKRFWCLTSRLMIHPYWSLAQLLAVIPLSPSSSRFPPDVPCERAGGSAGAEPAGSVGPVFAFQDVLWEWRSSRCI